MVGGSAGGARRLGDGFHGARPHGGESVAVLAARVQIGARRPLADPPVLWVTHGGVARAVCALRGLAEGWNRRVGFGEWLRIPPPT